MMEAGILGPIGLRESRAYLVLKSDGCSVRVVTDFKALNKCVKRPTHPTDSANQLSRQIKPTSRYFCTIYCVSGYHQVAVDYASADLSVISIPSGRYRMKVFAQGMSSASDILNIATDGSTRMDDNVIKNMDDICVFADSLPDLEKIINVFLKFCQSKNLKLKMSKFRISEQVEFAGATLSAELVQGEQVVNILPKDNRINAFMNLKRPENKIELRSFCGMFFSLQAWTLSIPLLRKACAKNGKLEWNQEMILEYEEEMKMMLTQIKLSYNEEKALYLVIDGASKIGAVLYCSRGVSGHQCWGLSATSYKRLILSCRS